MKRFLKFKAWVEQRKIQKILDKILLGLFVIALISIAFLSTNNSALSYVLGISKQVEPLSPTPTSLPAPTESPTPTPTHAPVQKLEVKSTYIDPDPIINCNIRPECGGGVMQMNKSQCLQSTCCRVGDTWNMFPNSASCTKAQSVYSSNRIYTYPTFPPLRIPTEPYPTVVPYQYSQEYLDSLQKANNTFNNDWKPSQFVAPTQKCYATWDEYFNAHPNYAPQNIQGMSGTPPCD